MEDKYRSTSLTVSLPLWMVSRIDKMASVMDCPRSRVLAKILEDYLELPPEEAKVLGKDSENPRLRRALATLRGISLSP